MEPLQTSASKPGVDQSFGGIIGRGTLVMIGDDVILAGNVPNLEILGRVSFADNVVITLPNAILGWVHIKLGDELPVEDRSFATRGHWLAFRGFGHTCFRTPWFLGMA